MPHSHRVQVPPDAAGDRLDKALARLIPSLSRHKARKVLAMGAVTLNGRRVRMSGYLVRDGDTLEATWHDDVLEPERFELTVVHEDTHVLVLHKPSGQLSQGSELGDVGSLAHALLKAYGPQVRLMHRLDKGTSGLMVATRTSFASRHLTPQFRDHTIGRRYLAILQGAPVDTRCEAPLRQVERRMRVARDDEEGMTARSDFRVLQRFEHPELGPLGLVEVALHTGRTHQIRVHARHLGHPVVGDPAYEGPPFDRVALHATHLAFEHPTGGSLSFDAPLPDALGALLPGGQ